MVFKYEITARPLQYFYNYISKLAFGDLSLCTYLDPECKIGKNRWTNLSTNLSTKYIEILFLTSFCRFCYSFWFPVNAMSYSLCQDMYCISQWVDYLSFEIYSFILWISEKRGFFSLIGFRHIVSMCSLTNVKIYFFWAITQVSVMKLIIS